MPDIVARQSVVPVVALYDDRREHDVWGRNPYAPGPDLVVYPMGVVGFASEEVIPPEPPDYVPFDHFGVSGFFGV